MSLAKTISGFMTFGAQHPNKPMWLTEFASVENPNDGTAKAQWIAQAQSLLQQTGYAQIAGVSYFNINTERNCVWPIETSAAATAAMRTLAQDPYFQGTVDDGSPPPPPPPPSGSIDYVAASATTGNAVTESVKVPSAVQAGDTLVLVATSSAPRAPAAPAGWNRVASATSPQMGSSVWVHAATAGDANSSVPVDFGGTWKGSVKLLAYSGVDQAGPVLTARNAAVDTSTTTLSTPTVAGVANGRLLLSYWATRTSVDTTLTPPAGVTTRNSDTGSGRARITSLIADSTSGTGGLTATVNPASGHNMMWSVVLSPAT